MKFLERRIEWLQVNSIGNIVRLSKVLLLIEHIETKHLHEEDG
jgi:hypothetical protein